MINSILFLIVFLSPPLALNTFNPLVPTIIQIIFLFYVPLVSKKITLSTSRIILFLIFLILILLCIFSFSDFVSLEILKLCVFIFSVIEASLLLDRRVRTTFVSSFIPKAFFLLAGMSILAFCFQNILPYIQLYDPEGKLGVHWYVPFSFSLSYARSFLGLSLKTTFSYFNEPSSFSFFVSLVYPFVFLFSSRKLLSFLLAITAVFFSGSNLGLLYFILIFIFWLYFRFFKIISTFPVLLLSCVLLLSTQLWIGSLINPSFEFISFVDSSYYLDNPFISDPEASSTFLNKAPSLTIRLVDIYNSFILSVNSFPSIPILAFQDHFTEYQIRGNTLIATFFAIFGLYTPFLLWFCVDKFLDFLNQNVICSPPFIRALFISSFLFLFFFTGYGFFGLWSAMIIALIIQSDSLSSSYQKN